MNNIIFSATGCARCKITKKYMQDNYIEYEEFDIKADGKDVFARFYRTHRKDIFRDENGVEFPVFSDGIIIRQGVSVIIGYLTAQDRLTGFIGRSRLHGQWLDGIHVSDGNPEHASDLYRVLAHLKKYGLSIELFSDGRNPEILEYIANNHLADRVIMEISRPVETIDYPEDLAKSLACATQFNEYYFYTTIGPLIHTDGSITFISPENIRDIAEFIETATGSKKHPYGLRRWDMSTKTNESLEMVEPMPESALFKYRTMARRYMVMAEIEK